MRVVVIRRAMFCDLRVQRIGTLDRREYELNGDVCWQHVDPAASDGVLRGVASCEVANQVDARDTRSCPQPRRHLREDLIRVAPGANECTAVDICRCAAE